jgi:hypothetical protein
MRLFEQSGIRPAIATALLSLLLSPGVLLAAKGPTDAECDAALSATVTEQQQLNFGTLLPGIAGTVSIDYKGTRTSSGPTLLSSTYHNAILVFSTGALDCSNNTPTVTLTPGSLTRIGGGSTPLTLNNLSYSTKSTNPFSKFNQGYFYIGGDLVVPASPESGSYSGTYGITVQFP